MSTLFISDLHLADERPAITEKFIAFLGDRARRADALYILGDLFEVWLGDDLILPGYQPALQAMRALSAEGVPLYFMHGNRDFLCGERFAELSGAQLLGDPQLIDLYGEPTLLMHGDSLCIDDHAYQQFRSMVRDPAWQAEFLGKPPEERIALARQAREGSREHTAQTAEGIMDVNSESVAAVMRDHGVRRLIHGHTHRPAVHELQLGNQSATRIVLGDWYEQGSVLSCDTSGCVLETI